MSTVGVAMEHALWAGTAAASFAVLLNVPIRALLPCSVTGLAGYLARTMLTSAGAANPVSASFLAADVVSLLGVAFGRAFRAPAIVFVIPGVIPLIPGALAFRTIAGLMDVFDTAGSMQEQALTAAGVAGLRTIMVTAALAAGVAVPGMILRRRRPML
jgi:uncharacterized membrane protein YjjB (DUF3815 family)